MLREIGKFTGIWMLVWTLGLLSTRGWDIGGALLAALLIGVLQWPVLPTALGLNRLYPAVSARGWLGMAFAVLLLPALMFSLLASSPAPFFFYLVGQVVYLVFARSAPGPRGDNCPVCEGRVERTGLERAHRDGEAWPSLRSLYACANCGHRTWRWADQGGSLREFDHNVL